MKSRATRRTFLRNSSLTACLLGVSPAFAFAQKASLKLGKGPRGPIVPADFMGLSYENM